MSDQTDAYQALAETLDTEDSRWAFGTGFDDPLAGVDAGIPATVDPEDLATYCLMLGDDALISSQRLIQWCTNAPELEDEVALANIALDLLGQARLLLGRAGQAFAAADGGSHDEDELAYFRDETSYRNVRLAELDNGDFARTMARLLVLSAHRLAVLDRLRGSQDPVLAAVAAKGLKEVTYHRDYAARWVVRLGDGTEYSRQRMVAGLDAVWPLLAELFAGHQVEHRVAEARVGVDPAEVRDEVMGVLDQALRAAGLQPPEEVAPLAGVGGRAGRDGVHTEALGPLLAEMQSLARAHPQARW